MPELPEVETIVRGLAACLPGRKIEGAAVSQPAVLRTPAHRFLNALRGAEVLELRRLGKFILIRMRAASRLRGREFWWIIHLGMTGQLILAPASEHAPPHTHAWFELGDESLRYTDTRRFGRMEITAPGSLELPARLARLGPDPLRIAEQEFAFRLKTRKARLKAVLLDQSFLAGIGNIYADEMLFRAGLHPAATASRLSSPRVAALWRAMREVLEEAVVLGGSSISDYLDSTGAAGSFQEQHRVYGRAGEACVQCGRRLKRLIIAGRGTTFCPHCQHKR